jgi:hypothetical protein
MKPAKQAPCHPPPEAIMTFSVLIIKGYIAVDGYNGGTNYIYSQYNLNL